jgi:hypothetical protein
MKINFKHRKNSFRLVTTRWTGFWPKITDLTQNNLKLIFTPVDMVWPNGLDFDPKRHETHFLPWFDTVWHGLTMWVFFYWKKVVDPGKTYFWILNFFLIFYIFIKKNRNKITFKRKSKKLGYYIVGGGVCVHIYIYIYIKGMIHKKIKNGPLFSMWKYSLLHFRSLHASYWFNLLIWSLEF